MLEPSTASTPPATRTTTEPLRRNSNSKRPQHEHAGDTTEQRDDEPRRVERPHKRPKKCRQVVVSWKEEGEGEPELSASRTVPGASNDFEKGDVWYSVCNKPLCPCCCMYLGLLSNLLSLIFHV